MAVDPMKSNSLTPADVSRLGAAGSVRRGEAASDIKSEPAAASGDRVQLSPASRTLVEQADEADRVPQGTMSAERMHEILRRLASDHYQQSSDATEAVARGVRRNLGLSTSE